MLMKDGLAHWISEEGSLWRLNCETLKAERLSQPSAELFIGWCDSKGAHTLKSSGEGIRVGLDAVQPGAVAREASGGKGPLRDIFAANGLIAVVGEQVVTLDSRTGYTLGGGKYTGQWVAGALADPQPDAPDQEPRLLMLTQDNDFGDLIALRPSSGGEEAVWRAQGVRPSGLLVAGKRLYVVHESGVVSIRSTAGALHGG
jgi:hypothetical protein